MRKVTHKFFNRKEPTVLWTPRWNYTSVQWSWSPTEKKKRNLMNLYKEDGHLQRWRRRRTCWIYRYKEVYHLQRRRGTWWIYTKRLVAYREEEEPDEYIYTKKLVTYREEDEPDESIQRSWSLTEKKKRSLMNIYYIYIQRSWSPTKKMNLMNLCKEVGHLQRWRRTWWIYTREKLVPYREEE